MGCCRPEPTHACQSILDELMRVKGQEALAPAICVDAFEILGAPVRLLTRLTGPTRPHAVSHLQVSVTSRVMPCVRASPAAQTVAYDGKTVR